MCIREYAEQIISAWFRYFNFSQCKQTKKRIHNIAKFFLHQQNTNNSSLMQNFANCIKRDVFEVKNAWHTREKQEIPQRKQM